MMEYEDYEIELSELTLENFQPSTPYSIIITKNPHFCTICGAKPEYFFLLSSLDEETGIEHTCGTVCTNNGKCLYSLLETLDDNKSLEESVFNLRKVRNVVKTPPEFQKKPISLTTRYNVLQRDGFQCVACGASGKVAQLEVDHICPVSKGGSNHESNLQTLCFNCNRGKRDRV
ncbi:MAG: HNH endonuclease [Desulfobacterales bacterium]|nr:HNH endonuclease [Desulfobacterales bacterium]